MELNVLLPIIALQIILMIIALVDLIRRDSTRVRGPKWLWVIIVLFISTIGPIVYLAAGRKE
jgi:hypothetical protein